MSELEEMRAFVQLVDAGTATKAAALKGVAVSAISRRMKDLEARLGVQLLQRTTRRMNLTAEGTVFYKRSVQLLADLAEAEAEITQQSSVLRGKLKVATPLSFGVAHLSPAIAAFMHAHPDIVVELDMSDRRVDLVEEGFDLAVRIGTLKDSSMMARKLADVRHVVCGAPSLFRQFGVPQQPADLEGWPGLCYGNLPNPPLWTFTDKDGASGSVLVSTRLQATNGDALRDAAVAGLGVLCEPSFIVHQAIERRLLQPILTDYRWYEMGIYAVYPPTRHLSSRVRRFIDFLTERFGPNPYWDEFLEN